MSSTAREKAAEVRAGQDRDERRRRMAIAGAAVGLVLVVVVALVLVKVLGGDTSSAPKQPGGVASAKLLKTLASVPDSAYDAVGVGTTQTGPQRVKKPEPLTKDGKPEIIYVGGEFCPYCAAQRWALVTALERFGDFTKLGTAHSNGAPEPFPNTATLSFHGSAYTSSVLSFSGTEVSGNKEAPGGGHEPLDTLPAADEPVVKKYNPEGSIPFIDITGRFLTSGASYDPGVLKGKTQQQIADALKDPSSDIAKAVLGSANVLTATICQGTGQQPADVCGSAGVTAAAKALGLS